MKFKDIFTNYWDMAITGFIGGLVVYLMIEYSKTIENKFLLAIFTFFIIFILIFIYSLVIWFTKKDNFRNLITNFFSFNNGKFYFKLIIFLLISIILYVLTFLLNKTQLLHPLLISSAIVLSSIIVVLLSFFKKLPKDSFNAILLFLFIIGILFILLTIWISMPNESRGINPNNLEAKFDFYIVNNEINQEELLKYISEANDILNKYNVFISPNNIYNVEINLTNEERHLLYSNISETDSEEENKRICNEKYMPIVNRITNNKPDMSIIYVNGEPTSGRGSVCGHSFVIFRQEKNSLLDLTGWNLAHELGHVFGLIHPENFYKINLMNDKHKVFYKSSFLTQKQVDSLINVQ